MIVAWKKTKTRPRTRTRTRPKFENKIESVKFDHRIIVIKEIIVFVRLRYFKFQDVKNSQPVISIKLKEW